MAKYDEADVSEWDIQKAVKNRLSYMDVHFWHTPNGAYSNPISGMQSKRAGVLPGVADMIVQQKTEPCPCCGRRGRTYAWELKTIKGKLSTSQERFLSNVVEYGDWGTFVTYGMGEAMKLLEEI